ncbi:hypothetical protein EJB05_33018, partial [Eragrostis curvula]
MGKKKNRLPRSLDGAVLLAPPSLARSTAPCLLTPPSFLLAPCPTPSLNEDAELHDRRDASRLLSALPLPSSFQPLRPCGVKMGTADQEDPRLFGTVRDAGGQPVTSPRVWLRDSSDHLTSVSVIRSIETARNFDFKDFPVKDKVSHMYYTGRLEVFNENFLVADQKLTYALLHCSYQSESNMRYLYEWEDCEVSYPCKAFIRCVANPGKVQSALSSIMIEKLNLTYPIVRVAFTE